MNADRPLLAGADAARALDIAERIVAEGVGWTRDESHEDPETPGGFAGCLLVAHALQRAGRTPAVSLRELAHSALVTSPERRGLYDGRAGLLAVLDAIAPDAASFARPRAALRAAVAEDLLATRDLDPARRTTFDLVSGAAGKLIALREAPEAVTEHVCELFARFADHVERMLGEPEPESERARLDIGVAHGVPGILAALNLTLPGERALARRYAELVVSLSHDVGGARRWDGAWSRDRLPPPRRAWCYQTAGVAAVLHDRALIEGDEALRALALGALGATLAEPEQPNWDDALCHGRAGVALVYARLQWEDERFARAAEQLAQDVLRNYRAEVRFGYRPYNLVHGIEEDRPQFLDAALGIAMFLIEAVAPSDGRWLALLGLRATDAA